MANGQSGGIGLGGVAAAFGGDRSAPNAVMFEGGEDLLRRTRGVSNDVLRNIRSSMPDFYSGYARGTQQQRGFQGEQEGVLRTLLNRRLNSDPQQLLQQTGNTLFGFIDPNVVNPLAQFDVNQNILSRRARGLNPAAVDSTAERLRNARIASGRYYDVARDVYNQLPNLYGQLRQAGITDDQLAAGYIPQIQQGYRQLDLAPLVPLREGLNIARGSLQIPADYGAAARALTYGFHQPTNIWDRAGDASQAISNTIQQAADIYASLGTGGIMGGGGGGMFGGGGYPARPAANTLPAAGSPYYSGYPAPTQWA